MVRAFGPAAVTATLLAGCVPKVVETTTESGTGTTGSTSSTGSTGELTTTTVQATTEPTTNASDTMVAPTATCECVGGDGTYDREACGWGPCGTIEFACLPNWDEPPCPDGTYVLDLDAMNCALDLLIAGTPGVVASWTLLGFGYERGFLKIGEGRTGISQTEYQYDLDHGASDFEVIQLRSAEYFQGCKDLTDPYERYKCLQDWTLASTSTICAEGYHCSFDTPCPSSGPHPPR